MKMNILIVWNCREDISQRRNRLAIELTEESVRARLARWLWLENFDKISLLAGWPLLFLAALSVVAI
jgi:hypothetical protein